MLPHVATGVERARLDAIFDHLTAYPGRLHAAPQAGAPVRDAGQDVSRAGEVEWATAEALAIGSLVLEGTPVRLAGEDSRRGTFSQRHAALIDYENENDWIPLDTLARTRRPDSGSTTACSASTPRSASSTATPTPTTRRW